MPFRHDQGVAIGDREAVADVQLVSNEFTHWHRRFAQERPEYAAHHGVLCLVGGLCTAVRWPPAPRNTADAFDAQR